MLRNQLRTNVDTVYTIMNQKDGSAYEKIFIWSNKIVFEFWILIPDSNIVEDTNE